MHVNGPRGSFFKNCERHTPSRWYGSRRNFTSTSDETSSFYLVGNFSLKLTCVKSFQLQSLIHLLLESLSSLLESLNAITDTRKLPEGSVQSIDEFVPSLRKIRKLAGMFPFCFPDKYIIPLHDSPTLIYHFRH